MRIPISTAVLFGMVVVTTASPVDPSRRLPRDNDELGGHVAGVGDCPKDCWNEAAAVANCDPNTDDACLCGPFLTAVTTCTSQTCTLADSLAALDFLEPACS